MPTYSGERKNGGRFGRRTPVRRSRCRTRASRAHTDRPCEKCDVCSRFGAKKYVEDMGPLTPRERQESRGGRGRSSTRQRWRRSVLLVLEQPRIDIVFPGQPRRLLAEVLLGASWLLVLYRCGT